MYFHYLLAYLVATFMIEGGVSFKVEVIPSPKTRIGARTHWDVEKQSLYYIDVYGNGSSILRYDYNEDKVYAAGIDGETAVPFIIPVADASDKYAVGLGKRVGIVNWDGKSTVATLDSVAFEVESDKKDNRFNSAKADPSGRFFGGTMISEKVADPTQTATGKVYKYVKGSGVSEVLDNIHISNGMAWDESKNKFYYIDSGKFDVKEYDYDPKTGNISNEKVVVDYKVEGKYPGFLPDGLTIDTDGNLYIGLYGASKVIKIDPTTGKTLLEISFPVKELTTVAFGGPNLDILYAITASAEDKSEWAGCLFKVTGLGAKGYPGAKVFV